jgi:DNA-binding transcriptional LysR family regulator
MVSQEQLEALDLLLWLGTGQQAADRQGCNQSSISRRIQGCLGTLGLCQRRGGGQTALRGRLDYLALEREVHQLVRFQRQKRLRLEATHCVSHLLVQPPLKGWILGSFDHHGVGRLHDLLRERVIDAWISSDVFDLPAPDDAELVAIPLSRWPARLLASGRHPLAGHTGVTTGDLDRFPVLEFPETIYPRMALALQDLGFGASHLRLPRYDRGSWNQQTADQVTLSFGGSLSALGVADQVMLDWNLGLISGESLILRRDRAEHQPIATLLSELHRRLAARQSRCPDLTVLV